MTKRLLDGENRDAETGHLLILLYDLKKKKKKKKKKKTWTTIKETTRRIKSWGPSRSFISLTSWPEEEGGFQQCILVYFSQVSVCSWTNLTHFQWALNCPLNLKMRELTVLSGGLSDCQWQVWFRHEPLKSTGNVTSYYELSFSFTSRNKPSGLICFQKNSFLPSCFRSSYISLIFWVIVQK
jgi:hypothetical protein